MGLADVIRAGVATAAKLTAELQAAVTHEVWTGQDALGAPTYAAPVTRRALVEPSTRLLQLADGRQVSASTKLTFLSADPVDSLDRLTLPDGSQPSILAVQAPPLDADGEAVLWQVWCG